ncbi:ribonuclease HI [Glycomyces salinus]|uniref:ribonuclease HI n=1 Tax=Glycomyces salinus TaxID=980294 RepID=UPI0018EB9285|nr:ribonuclease HI [Glycomyces salinus]
MPKTDELQETAVIYTDGACSGNPGPGGWGVYFKWGDHEKELYGAEKVTTNNRMELTAAIMALESLKRPMKVDLFTDSSYVRNGILSWIAGWKRNGWKNAKKEPVKNADLWRRLDQAAAEHDVEWHWVRGHSGDPGNERADRLAVKGRDEAAGAAGRARR